MKIGKYYNFSLWFLRWTIFKCRNGKWGKLKLKEVVSSLQALDPKVCCTQPKCDCRHITSRKSTKRYIYEVAIPTIREIACVHLGGVLILTQSVIQSS